MVTCGRHGTAAVAPGTDIGRVLSSGGCGGGGRSRRVITERARGNDRNVVAGVSAAAAGSRAAVALRCGTVVAGERARALPSVRCVSLRGNNERMVAGGVYAGTRRAPGRRCRARRRGGKTRRPSVCVMCM